MVTELVAMISGMQWQLEHGLGHRCEDISPVLPPSMPVGDEEQVCGSSPWCCPCKENEVVVQSARTGSVDNAQNLSLESCSPNAGAFLQVHGLCAEPPRFGQTACTDTSHQRTVALGLGWDRERSLRHAYQP